MLENVYEVAFRRNTNVILIKSFDDTIDVEFGIHNDGKLAINLMPSDGIIDWKINFNFFQKKVKPAYANLNSKVKIHRGFYNEWMKNRESFFNIIRSDDKFMSALSKGLYCVGRSKGGSEAIIIALDLVRNFTIDKENVFVGALDAAKTGNKEFCKSVERYINKSNIYTVRYLNDLITQIPPFGFYNPGVKIRVGKGIIPMPFVDHALGCFKEEELKVIAKKYDSIYDGTTKNVRIK